MIIIVTYSNYPNGSASAIRYATFEQAYRDMKYDVAIIDKFINGMQHSNESRWAKYKRYLLFSYNVIKSIRELMLLHTIDAVIIGSDVRAIHAAIIQRWCHCNRLKCVFDATEWYSKEQVNRWLLSTSYWEKEFLNRWVINKRSRVIAISSYLYDYFNEKGCKVTRIPVICNPKSTSPLSLDSNKNNDNTLRIIYAGSHLKMDNLPLIIEALSMTPDEQRKKIKFVVYGITRDKIREYISDEVLLKLQDTLHIMGRKPNSEVIEAYKTADFSILLRDPNLRVNKAGFPSKVVESMRMGVPVICNYTSDLELYLQDKHNCIIVDQLDTKTLCNFFKDLINMPLLHKLQIGQNAIHSVTTQLSSQQFETNFKNIIS